MVDLCGILCDSVFIPINQWVREEAMFANPPLVVFLVIFIILGSFGIPPEVRKVPPEACFRRQILIRGAGAPSFAELKLIKHLQISDLNLTDSQ